MKRWSSIFLAMALILGFGAPVRAAVNPEESVTRLERARDFITKNELRSAVIELKNALRANPGNLDARFTLGEVYLRLGDVVSAEKEFDAAARRGLKTDAVILRLAQARLLQGKFQLVFDSLSAEELTGDAVADGQVLLGRALLGLKKPEEARAKFLEAEKILPDGVQAKVELSRLLARNGEMKAAEEMIDRALDIAPRLPAGLLLKGELKRQQGDLEDAVVNFAAAIEVQPNNITARLGRAAALIDLDRIDEAQADLKAIDGIVANHPLAVHFRAVIATKQSRFKEANELLQSAAGALDNYLPSVYLKGVISYALGNYEQAVASLSRFLEKAPGNVLGMRLYGAALLRIGDYKKVVAALEPAVRDGLADSRLYSLLGAAHMGLREFSRAMAYYEKAAAMGGDLSGVETQLAISKLAGGDVAGGVANLESVVDVNPDAGQAAVLLALVELRKRDFDSALKRARQFTERFPDNPLGFNLLGAARLGKGDLAGAKSAFESALKAKQDYFPALLNLAQIDIREGRLEKAKQRYQKILAANENHAGAMISLGDIALREKNTALAGQWYEKAYAANPAVENAGLKLVQYYLGRRENDKALATARQVSQRFPRSTRSLESLGRSQAAGGDAAGALATFRKLAVTAPKSAAAQNLVGRAAMATADMTLARQSFEKALSLTPDYGPAQQGMVALEVNQGNLEAALKRAMAIYEKAEHSPGSSILLGDIYLRMKRHKEALDIFRQAYGKAPGRLTATRLFQAYLAADDDESGFSVLESWLAGHQEDNRSRHLLASALLGKGKLDRAIAEYKMLERKDPDNKIMVLNNLAWLYQKTGNDQALAVAKRAYDLAPDTAAISDTYGWIMLESGDKEKALQLLRKATALAPGQPEIRYHFAVALDRNGRPDEARRELQDLLQTARSFTQQEEARALLKSLARQ